MAVGAAYFALGDFVLYLFQRIPFRCYVPDVELFVRWVRMVELKDDGV